MGSGIYIYIYRCIEKHLSTGRRFTISLAKDDVAVEEGTERGT